MLAQFLHESNGDLFLSLIGFSGRNGRRNTKIRGSIPIHSRRILEKNAASFDEVPRQVRDALFEEQGNEEQGKNVAR